MAMLINRYNAAQHGVALRAMFRARKRVFVDLLGWDVPHDAEEERDEFDDEHATYLIVSDEHSGAHLGSVRLLRTDRRHILGDLFAQLCEDMPPRGPDVRELTRFCLSPGIGRIARRQVRARLVRAFLEYALLSGIRAYTGVAHMGWLSQILAAGWQVRPLGLPQMIDRQLLGAIQITITSQTLHELAPDWRCEPSPPRIIEFGLPLAA